MIYSVTIHTLCMSPCFNALAYPGYTCGRHISIPQIKSINHMLQASNPFSAQARLPCDMIPASLHPTHPIQSCTNSFHLHIPSTRHFLTIPPSFKNLRSFYGKTHVFFSVHLPASPGNSALMVCLSGLGWSTLVHVKVVFPFFPPVAT